jgi:DNA-nicking Smr family endonuclease
VSGGKRDGAGLRPEPAPEPEPDQDELARALGDVKPLPRRDRVPPRSAPPPRAPDPAPGTRAPTAEPSGPAFEGHVRDLDLRALRRLGRGDPPAEAELDLHGLHKGAAQQKLRAFLQQSLSAGRRAIRIVHGRGLHSGGEPVLRTEVARCLHAAVAAGDVLAFRPAPPTEGGEGAVHVLLRSGIKRR